MSKGVQFPSISSAYEAHEQGFLWESRAVRKQEYHSFGLASSRLQASRLLTTYSYYITFACVCVWGRYWGLNLEILH